MKSGSTFFKLIGLTLLLAITSACKPGSTGTNSSSSTTTTTLPNTPNYPLAFTYTIPGTSQVINVYQDVTGPNAPHNMDIQHALANLPASQLVGITSLYFSNYVDTIEANVYANLSPQNLNEWTNLVQARNDPAAEFKSLYEKWLSTFSLDGLNQFYTYLKSHDVFDASEYLTMAAEFLDPVKHIIWTYGPVIEPGEYSFDAANIAYSITNNILNIDGGLFGLQMVNNVLSIVSADGVGVQPMPVPDIFMQDAGIAAVSDVNGNIVVSGMGASATGMLSVEGSPAASNPNITSTAAPGKIGKLNTFVSPYTPNIYHSALDSTSQTEMLKEIQILQTDPKEILQQAPGAVSHGFSAESTK